MKPRNRLLLLLLVLTVAGLGTPAPRVVSAQDVGESSASTTWDGGSPEIERWWGAAGAVMCGAEGYLLRSVPTVGLNPYVMTAGIAGCLIALLDIATT